MTLWNIYVDERKSIFVYRDRDDVYNVGSWVIIPFGRQKLTGIILEKSLLKEEDYEFKIQDIYSESDSGMELSPEYIRLLLWTSQYYVSPFASLFGAAIPKDITIKHNKYYTVALENIENSSPLDAIVVFLMSRLTMSQSSLTSRHGTKTIKSLIAKGILTKNIQKISLNISKYRNTQIENLDETEKEVLKHILDRLVLTESMLRNTFGVNWKRVFKKSNIEIITIDKVSDKAKEKSLESSTQNVDLRAENLENDIKSIHMLSDEQEKIKSDIVTSQNKFHLIHGITGSGKTEIYIELMKEGLARDCGSIFLVPEISLTPQLMGRLRQVFRENIAILHSMLTPRERQEEWINIYNGTKKIVLGARSAIFAPIPNLAYIIIDEEHENTYKQDTSPRYSAKMVALKRAYLESTKVIMGSATPSIESYYYGKSGIFQLHKLVTRYNGALLPAISIVDMKKEESQFFSRELLTRMRDALLHNEQIILFLNRKGYSTYVQCKECGHVEECPHCSIKYTYHTHGNYLKCNYCGETHGYNGTCSHCGSTNISYLGKGVERIEEEIKSYFDEPMIVVDSDRAKTRDFYARAYADFAAGKYKIMVGTQVVAKGLHFPNVTLVGVINADIILNFPDFRASEKTYQVVTQVAGRAGRGQKPGTVVIQTYQPENHTFEHIAHDDYESFYAHELDNRRLIGYPPFSKTINIGISSTDEEIAKEYSNIVKKDISDNVPQGVEIYGPMKSLVYKVKDRYRHNIFVKGNRESIEKYKKILKEKLEKYLSNKNVRVIIDIDPINLI